MGRTSSTVKDRWNKKAYDQLLIRIPKGRKADIEQYAEAHGQSLNGFIAEVVRESIGMTPEAWKITAAEEEEEG